MAIESIVPILTNEAITAMKVFPVADAETRN